MAMKSRLGESDETSGFEWEYEYSSTEYETFYIPLHLPVPKISSNPTPKQSNIFDLYVPTVKGRRKRQVSSRKETPNTDGKSVKRRRRLRTRDIDEPNQETTVVEEDEEIDNEDANDVENNESIEIDPGVTAGEAIQKAIDAIPDDEYDVSNNNATSDDKNIQILGLDTENPIIMYQGAVYKCNWEIPLGSDMIFSASHEQSHDHDTPLVEFDGWNLLGISAARLVAHEAKITPKQAEATPDEKSKHRESFLKRFMDLKVRKGEIMTQEELQRRASLGHANAQNEEPLPPMANQRALRALFTGPPGRSKPRLSSNQVPPVDEVPVESTNSIDHAQSMYQNVTDE